MTDYATNAAVEIRRHIREFGANSGMSAHSLGVITAIISRHRSARERELEAALEAADKVCRRFSNSAYVEDSDRDDEQCIGLAATAGMIRQARQVVADIARLALAGRKE